MPSKSNDLFSLPIGPEELCFDKNEFIKVSKTLVRPVLQHPKNYTPLLTHIEILFRRRIPARTP